MSHGPPQVDPPTALERLNAGTAWLVDVRERAEIARAAFDAPNVVVMPLSEFERRRDELPRDQDLILACASGGRSFQAVHYLVHHGYSRVSNLAGGIGLWHMHGLPVKVE